MSDLQRRIRRFLPAFVLAVPMTAVTVFAAEEKNGDKQKREERLQYMADIVGEFDVSPDKPTADMTGEFHEEPIMRYSDPPRGMLDATIWKMGKQERPETIVTLEMHRREDSERGLLSYEFLNLTPESFRLRTERGSTWRPRKTSLEFRRFEKAPVPGKTPLLRLQQARQFARRFSATERHGGETYELRLLPRPIDQYSVGKSQNKETGAIFAFVHGTNPELLLFVESSGDGWQYGFGRLAAARLTVELDEKVVWTKKGMWKIGYSWRNPYTATRRYADFP